MSKVRFNLQSPPPPLPKGPDYMVLPYAAPRVLAIVNGIEVSSVTSFETVTDYSSNLSRFELSISGDDISSSANVSDWLLGTIYVNITIYDATRGSPVSIFSGIASGFQFDPILNTFSISGGDYSGFLVSSVVSLSFINQTASDVAYSFATNHGFLTQISPTLSFIGTYSGSDYSQIVLSSHDPIMTEWKVLRNLAHTEGFEFFMDGNTLVFASLSEIPRSITTVRSADCETISFGKRIPLVGQFSISTQSWNSWQSAMFTGVATADGEYGNPEVSALDASQPLTYVVTAPDLSPSSAEILAQRTLSRIENSEVQVAITMPGECSLKPLDILVVQTNGTTFDMAYTIVSIRRRYSARLGFIQHVRAQAAWPG